MIPPTVEPRSRIPRAPRCSRRGGLAVLAVLAGCWIAQPAAAGWQNFRGGAGGLADDVVRGIAEGHDGTIWFATSDGVSRFDGTRWETFRDSLEVSANVYDLLQDSRGAWWFGTKLGLVKYDNGSWSVVERTRGLQINDLLEDASGDLWVGSVQSLERYEPSLERWTTFNPLGTGLFLVQKLFEDSGRRLWVASVDAGNVPTLRRLDEPRAAWTAIPPDPAGLASDSVLAMAEDADAGMWFGTAQGAFHLRDGQWSRFRVADGLPYDIVSALAVDSLGIVWIGCTDRVISPLLGGIARFDGRTMRADFTTSEAPSRALGPITALQIDRSGNAWIGSRRFGAFLYDRSTWRHWYSALETPCPARRPPDVPWRNVLSSNCLVAGFVDHVGEKWFSTFDAGVNRLRRADAWQTLRRAPGVPLSDSVAAIAEDRQGALWFGSRAAGVARLDSMRTTWTAYTTEDGLTDDHALAVYVDRVGDVWVGTQDGASRWDGTSWSGVLQGQSAEVRGFLEDGTGRLWMRTSIGLHSLDVGRTQLTRWTAPDLVDDTVNAMLLAGNGDLWFGTSAGASRLSSGAWTSWSTFGQFGDGNVYAMIEDGTGGVWVGTDAGAARYDGSGWTSHSSVETGGSPVTAFHHDRSGTLWLATLQLGATRYIDGRWRKFDVTNGLSSNDVSGFHEDAQGRLWFLTNGGLTEHEPDRTAPQTVFTLTPRSLLASRDVSFAFGAAYGEVTDLEYSVSWDGAPFSAWSDVNTYVRAGVPDGLHRFESRSRDFLHHEDPTPASFVFEVDATPPTAEIASPPFGLPVRGRLAILGTAADPRFRRFAVHVRPLGAPAWTELDSATTPVVGDTLATWDTAALADGDWEIRLTVADTLGVDGVSRVRVIVDNVAPFASVTSPVRIVASLGGEVYTTGAEMHLYFPPGAFDRDAIVTVDSVATADLPTTLPDGAVRASGGWDVGWSAAALGSDAVLEMRTAPGDTRALAVYVQQGAAPWRRLGGSRQANGSIGLQLSAPGRHALFAESVTPSGPGGVSALTLTPRAFSPRGSFASTDVAIGFALARSGSVTVKVYNRAGRRVRSVAEDVAGVPGDNVVRWNGRDDDGRAVSAGLYLVSVESLGEVRTQTLAVLR